MAGAFHSNGGPWRLSTHQSVGYTGTAGTITNAVGGQTRIVRVVMTTAGYVAIGSTATTSSAYMPADIPDYFKINPGERVSAIQLSSGGTLHITELTA